MLEKAKSKLNIAKVFASFKYDSSTMDVEEGTISFLSDVLPYVATLGTRKSGSNKHFCLTSLGVSFQLTSQMIDYFIL